MDIKNILSLAGVSLLIGAAGWYWGMGRPAPVSTEDERRPDYIIYGLDVLESDQTGLLSRQLHAPEVRHFSLPAEEAEIDQPAITLYDKGVMAWEVSARSGRILNQNTEYRLERNVEAHRRLPNAIPVVLKTEKIHIFPKEERLFSNTLVTVDAPQGHLQSNGIEANLKAGYLVLNQQVQGTYAPPSH